MTRDRVLRIIRKHLPDASAEDVFEASSKIYATTMHLTALVNVIINNIMLLPEEYSRVIFKRLGIDEYHYVLLSEYRNLVEMHSVAKKATRAVIAQASFSTAVVILHRTLISPSLPEFLPVRTPDLDVKTRAIVNSIALELYPVYVNYYIVITTMIMLIKALFSTFAHLMQLMVQLPPACFDEYLVACDCDLSMKELIRKNWVLDLIMRRQEQAA